MMRSAVPIWTRRSARHPADARAGRPDRAQTGIRNTLENTALRVKVAITARFSTDSLEVSKHLVETGIGYAVLPLAACGAEVEAGRLRYAGICEPEISHQL